jgi:hypothetical protein
MISSFLLQQKCEIFSKSISPRLIFTLLPSAHIARSERAAAEQHRIALAIDDMQSAVNRAGMPWKGLPLSGFLRLSTKQIFYLSIYMSTHPSIHPSIRISIHPPSSPSFCPQTLLARRLSAH